MEKGGSDFAKKEKDLSYHGKYPSVRKFMLDIS